MLVLRRRNNHIVQRDVLLRGANSILKILRRETRQISNEYLISS